MRWQEEVRLVCEEMRRVKEWLRWQVEWWDQVGRQHDESSLELKEGLLAHTARQAQLQRDMLQNFEQLWKDMLAFVEVEIMGEEGPRKTD